MRLLRTIRKRLDQAAQCRDPSKKPQPIGQGFYRRDFAKMVGDTRIELVTPSV